jgi:hypothetical protein
MPHFQYALVVPGRLSVVLGLVLCTAVCGCSSGKPQTVEVSGLVTIEGKPLDRALIFFDATGDNQGPRAAGVIRNGEYFLEPDQGPVAGPLRVAIVSETEDDTPAPNQLAKRYPREKIPAQYNARSILTVEATADGPNIFDFDLRNQRR